MDLDDNARDIVNLIFAELLCKGGFDEWYGSILGADRKQIKRNLTAVVGDYLEACNILVSHDPDHGLFGDDL